MNNKCVVFDSSRKADGNMSFCYGDTAGSLKNRKKFLSVREIPWQNLVCAKQVHGDVVRVIGEGDCGRGALSYEDAFDDTDGFITDKKNIPLSIFTADCLPVFLYDPSTEAIGMIHAGWRSSQKNITAKAIALMCKVFSVDPSDLIMHMGPAIRSCCYQVGQEFTDYFPGSVASRGGQCYLDLACANRKQAHDAGVKAERITDDHHCTCCCQDDFFSFRRQGQESGRSLSVIMLR
jgi:YfiH family protein